MNLSTTNASSHRPLARACLLRALLLLLCCLPATGCSVIDDTFHVFFLAKRTTKLEPKHFPYIRNEKLTRRRDTQLAERVWAEVSGSMDTQCTHDYERGFITGFADYMYRGGDGETPLVPPRDYWQLGYQSEQGKQSIDDWYEGFRHGVEECRARGYRQMVVVRSSLLGAPYDHVMGEGVLPMEVESLEPTPAEILPVPEAASADPLSAVDRHDSWSPDRPDPVQAQPVQRARHVARQLRPARASVRQQTTRKIKPIQANR